MARRTDPPRPSAPPHPPRLYKLLAQVAQYYRRRFVDEVRARQYLAERGLSDKQALEVFGAGYCDGTLHDVLPYDDQVLADLKTLGVLNDNGKELLRECVVFPLWDVSGACVGLYGRRLFDSEVRHLYLPGPRRGLCNWQAAKRDGELVLTESVLDALSLYVAGVHGALPCYGTGGFTDDHAALLARFGSKPVAICFDGDEAGRRGAEELAARLREQRRGAVVRVVRLPADADPNSLLLSKGAASLRQLVEGVSVPPFDAAPAPPVAVTTPAPIAGATTTVPHVAERTAQGFVLQLETRRYEVKAMACQGTQLRATLKASKANEDGGRFELTTIDLYSRRSRSWYAGLCAELFGIEPARAEADLQTVVSRAEEASGSPSASEPARIELTAGERAEALAMLCRPDLVEQVLRDLELVGYAGEPTNKLLAYVVAVSRKLERPLSLLVESRSGAGKSALQDAVLGCVPQEECLKYSRITDQALFYKAQDGLEGKLLVIEEAAGMGGAAYSIRALQSGDELRVAATGKDPLTGKLRTEEYVVKARTSVMMTTTQPDFDEETKSRFIRATVNESPEMTERILDVQRQAETIEGIALRRRSERVRTLHQNAQRLLQSVTVANPYAPRLTYPARSLAARRDNVKYLGLMKAIALLHQHQREVKEAELHGERLRYIEVTLADIALANRIAKDVLTTGSQDVTPQARRLLGLVRAMLVNGHGKEAKGEVTFTRRRLREHAGWSDWQLRTHLAELVELEYLRVHQGRSGKEYVYELGDVQMLEAAPGFGLTDVEALRAALEPKGRASSTYDERNLVAKSTTSRSKAATSRHLVVTP